MAFTDALPSGVVAASPSGISNNCGGIAVAVAGSGSVSLSGGALADNAECTIALNVTGTTAGTKINVTGAITSNEGGTGRTASATLIVVAPPVIAKAFGAPNISLNGGTSLTFTLTNPAANSAALREWRSPTLSRPGYWWPRRMAPSIRAAARLRPWPAAPS